MELGPDKQMQQKIYESDDIRMKHVSLEWNVMRVQDECVMNRMVD